MWKTSHTEIVNSSSRDIWQHWTDVSKWPKQDESLQSAELLGEFKIGSIIILKPKGSPKVKVKLTEVTKDKSFSSIGKLPLAKLRFSHKIKTVKQGVSFTQSIEISGPLSGLFGKMMGNKMASNLEKRMIKLAKIASKH